jgi:hypothetical protein
MFDLHNNKIIEEQPWLCDNYLRQVPLTSKYDMGALFEE